MRGRAHMDTFFFCATSPSVSLRFTAQPASLASQKSLVRCVGSRSVLATLNGLRLIYPARFTARSRSGLAGLAGGLKLREKAGKLSTPFTVPRSPFPQKPDI